MTRLRVPEWWRGGRHSHGYDDSKGSSAVEFAVIASFVFLPLVFGIMYFGFLFAQNLSLGNAARQGARAAVVNDGTTCGSIVGIVQNNALTVGIKDPSSVKVTIQRRAAPSGSATPSPYSINCDLQTSPTSSVTPCASASPGESIYVKALFTSTMTFPYLTTHVDAKGEGEFRCEWN